MPAKKPTLTLLIFGFFINFYVGFEPMLPTQRAGVLSTKLTKVFNATLKSVDRGHLLLYSVEHNSN